MALGARIERAFASVGLKTDGTSIKPIKVDDTATQTEQ